MTSKHWQNNVPQDRLVTGDHKSDIVPFKAREYQSKDKGQQRFVEAVKAMLSHLTANKPAYDTGYQYVTANTDYDIEHNLGYYPSCVACYFSAVAEPKESVDVIYHIAPGTMYNAGGEASGFRLHSLSKKKMQLKTETTNVLCTSDESLTFGYMRIQVWR